MIHMEYKSFSWEETAYPGIEVFEVENKANRLRYFKIDKGSKIPMHSHNGNEKIVLLSGEMEFSGKKLIIGDLLSTEKGEKHEAFALKDSLIFILNERISTI